ncbi:uncharacterized protein LOC110446902 [Mizuhopecten yessoensis]|uniref:Beta-microseminoprotein n=1 Tax=Mizuhopecten yessoensis TaxID=6573 RepID=A0A210QWG9_MIZYE|nr:uncharacterized protein LOC110446902 [Mizuhopecten yessoensis]OWF53063.1 hypothetical protein KP79_PYT24079 [Mizuhopecten yessoensis]
MNINILFLLVILLSANQISAYCLNKDPAPGGNSQPTVCTYKGRTYSPGEAWDADNCEECQCDEDGGRSCCGYGFNAVVMNFGVGCKLERFDCLNGAVVDADEAGGCEMTGTEIHLKRSKKGAA